MATISVESATSNDTVRLARKPPEVARSSAGSERFTVKFELEGTGLLELQNALTARAASVGVERISRMGTTLSLHGVEHGRESEVFFEVQAAIDDVNRARQAAEEISEQRRLATEEANAVSDAQVRAVRESFAAAARSAPSSSMSTDASATAVQAAAPPDPASS
jgi:hypothetical protein